MITEISGIITVVSGVITAIATASAAIAALISLYQLIKEDKREKDLVIENFKEQLNLFARWYDKFARKNLNDLHNYSRANVPSRQVCEEIMRKIPMCNADLNYWKENHMKIRQAMKKKKYKEECIRASQEFMMDLIEFMKVYECVSQKLGESKESFENFKDNFYKDVPSTIVIQYGNNFNASLGEMLNKIQVKYASLASQLKLKYLDISGV